MAPVTSVQMSPRAGHPMATLGPMVRMSAGWKPSPSLSPPILMEKLWVRTPEGGGPTAWLLSCQAWATSSASAASAVEKSSVRLAMGIPHPRGWWGSREADAFPAPTGFSVNPLAGRRYGQGFTPVLGQQLYLTTFGLTNSKSRLTSRESVAKSASLNSTQSCGASSAMNPAHWLMLPPLSRQSAWSPLLIARSVSYSWQ